MDIRISIDEKYRKILVDKIKDFNLDLVKATLAKICLRSDENDRCKCQQKYEKDGVVRQCANFVACHKHIKKVLKKKVAYVRMKGLHQILGMVLAEDSLEHKVKAEEVGSDQIDNNNGDGNHEEHSIAMSDVC